MSTKIKILIVGSIGENVVHLVKKLTSLQSGKAGPFDACFCVGPVAASIAEHTMPLPVYLQGPVQGEKPTEGRLREINTNLFCLGDGAASIQSLKIKQTELVVVSVPPHARLDSPATKSLQEKLDHVSYVGCDLFLSSEWPQGIEQVIPSDVQEVGSFDIAELALRSRPRYLVSPYPLYFQSNPFSHLASSSSTFAPKHTGRFLAIAPVVPPAEAKPKGKMGKFIHALGLTPLQYMTAAELDQKPERLQPCPFTDSSYQTDGNSTSSVNVGLSEAQARRLIAESNKGNEFRWKQKRELGSGEVDESSTTLFIHGLHKDVTGQLQTGTVTLLQAFEKYGVERVKRPPAANSYAFLEFPSHEAARECLEETGGEVLVAGIHLTLKWGSQSAPGHQQPPQKKRLTEQEAVNSNTLYFRLPHKVLTDERSAVGEDLRKLMEKTLENALGGDVTAEEEPALQVKKRQGEVSNFGFLEFASHAAASMALATLTGSTDGGIVQAEDEHNKEIPDVPKLLVGAALYWSAERETNHFVMETASGIKFERQHFPVDSRTDCWFCLASPTCEKHLITSVHNQCYITMPKGPVHPEGHTLIVPVTHSSQGALVDPTIAQEVNDLKAKLRHHAMEKWDMDLFCFERAFQTKGGYHTHVQCVPIAKGLGIKVQAAMIAMARQNRFQLREVNTDLALSAIAQEGYFYSEIPLSGKEYKRFIYTAEDDGRCPVPIQFGREVLASALNNPDLAHWKACVMDKDQETKLASAFRESFSKYEA